MVRKCIGHDDRLAVPACSLPGKLGPESEGFFRELTVGQLAIRAGPLPYLVLGAISDR
ncbi:hypothetical protein GCM10027057_12940 [Marisediminicola antarctica]